MAVGLGLSLRTSQSLALTPQLQQSIRMLQLSALELAQEIQQAIEQNPCLTQDDEDEEGGLQNELELDGVWALPESPRAQEDSGTSGDAAEASEPPDGASGETSADAEDWGGDGSLSSEDWDANWAEMPSGERGSSDEDRRSEPRDASVSLSDHLLAQTRNMRLSDLERVALAFVVHNLDEDGFLREEPEELALALSGELGLATLHNVDVAEAEDSARAALRFAIRAVQQLEPLGVGTRGPVDALRVQAEHHEVLANTADDAQAAQEWRVVLGLLSAPLQWIALRDLGKLARHAGVSAEAVDAALARLRTLTPRPAAAYGEPAASAVIPEVLVRRVGSRLKVELNPRVRQSLRVDPWLAERLRGQARDSAMAQKLQEARWFVKNLTQRYDTILRVSQVIVDRQRRFFLHGATEMRPLVLREVADELGVHESTVSRVTTAKYLQSPTGTFELKYFFASALETHSGAGTSATAVKAMLKAFIAEENPSSPLSDTELAACLERRGVVCARRTVAKYREALHIPVAQLRKAEKS